MYIYIYIYIYISFYDLIMKRTFKNCISQYMINYSSSSLFNYGSVYKRQQYWKNKSTFFFTRLVLCSSKDLIFKFPTKQLCYSLSFFK